MIKSTYFSAWFKYNEQRTVPQVKGYNTRQWGGRYTTTSIKGKGFNRSATIRRRGRLHLIRSDFTVLRVTGLYIYHEIVLTHGSITKWSKRLGY